MANPVLAGLDAASSISGGDDAVDFPNDGSSIIVAYGGRPKAIVCTGDGDAVLTFPSGNTFDLGDVTANTLFLIPLRPVSILGTATWKAIY